MFETKQQNIIEISEENNLFSSPYFEYLKDPNNQLLLFVLIVLLLLNLFSDDRKGKLATSRWGAKKELDKAKKKALKQMSKVTRNSVALYIGSSKETIKLIDKKSKSN